MKENVRKMCTTSNTSHWQDSSEIKDLYGNITAEIIFLLGQLNNFNFYYRTENFNANTVCSYVSSLSS